MLNLIRVTFVVFILLPISNIDARYVMKVRRAPGTLVINSAVAGSGPVSVTDTGAQYKARITHGGTVKVTGSIDSLVPANTTLEIQLAPTTGATSMGFVTLTTADKDLVTGVGATSPWLQISYRFSASVLAGVVPSTSRTVSFTLVDE